jgi:hypothetical protein
MMDKAADQRLAVCPGETLDLFEQGAADAAAQMVGIDGQPADHHNRAIGVKNAHRNDLAGKHADEPHAAIGGDNLVVAAGGESRQLPAQIVHGAHRHEAGRRRSCASRR